MPNVVRSPVVKNTDGSHEYDFDFGTWHTHTTRMLHPLSGKQEWTELDGTTVVTPIWGGRANLAEYKASGPNGPIELLALRIYNPTTHQWSINFATPKGGELSTAPGIGQFKNDRIDFYDQEAFQGRMIMVRNGFSDIAPNSSHFEQAFSDDAGKTWETNWIVAFTRDKRP